MRKTFDEMLYDAFQAGMWHTDCINRANSDDARHWDKYDVSDEKAFQQWKEEWRVFGVAGNYQRKTTA